MQRARVTTSGWTGGPGLYTFYSQGSGTEDATTAQDMVDALDDVFLEIQGVFPTAWTATPVLAVDTINVGTGAITATNTVTGWTRTGGSSSGWGALAVGGCVTWLTDTFLAGRRLKGRTFVSPTASEFVDTDGSPKSSLVSSLNNFGAAWVAALGGASAPVIWHRPVGGSGGSNSPITAATVKDKFAVLRSRRD